jgi:starch phosphorylase
VHFFFPFLTKQDIVFQIVMAAIREANGATGRAIPAKVPAVAQPLADEPAAIASNINYHAQFSPHFSPFKFEPEQAYYATAESVRDRLVQVRFLSLFGLCD